MFNWIGLVLFACGQEEPKTITAEGGSATTTDTSVDTGNPGTDTNSDTGSTSTDTSTDGLTSSRLVRDIVTTGRLGLGDTGNRGSHTSRRSSLIRGTAARSAASAVTAGAHHERAAIRAHLAMTKIVHTLAASHTALVVYSQVDATNSAHARDLSILIVLTRERHSLVQAASLASRLTATRRHHLLRVSLCQNTALVLHITPSARVHSATGAAASKIGIHGAPVADIPIQAHGVGASQPSKAREAYN